MLCIYIIYVRVSYPVRLAFTVDLAFSEDKRKITIKEGIISITFYVHT